MRVILADDQQDVRSALRLLLEDEPGLSIVGEAAEVGELLSQVARSGPDLILLDWELPGLATDVVLLRLRSNGRNTRVIALSGKPEARQVSLEAGADAFVSKGDPPEKLLATVRALAVN